MSSSWRDVKQDTELHFNPHQIYFEIFIVMNKNQILSLIRHTLTFVGGVLITQGLVDDSQIEQIIAGIITLTGLIWGVIEKKTGV